MRVTTQKRLKHFFGDELWATRKDAPKGMKFDIPVLPCDGETGTRSIFDCDMVHAMQRVFNTPKTAMTRTQAYVPIDGVLYRFTANRVAKEIAARKDIGLPAASKTLSVKLSPPSGKYHPLGAQSVHGHVKRWREHEGKPIVEADQAKQRYQRAERLVEKRAEELAAAKDSGDASVVKSKRAALHNAKVDFGIAKSDASALEAKVAHRRRGPHSKSITLPEGVFDRELLRDARGKAA